MFQIFRVKGAAEMNILNTMVQCAKVFYTCGGGGIDRAKGISSLQLYCNHLCTADWNGNGIYHYTLVN